MDREFWLQRWASDNIAFHESDVNPLLLEHFDALSLEKGARVFIPLCGKTLDIAWLLSRGYSVVGIELSPKAVDELVAQLGIQAKPIESDSLIRYSGDGVDIFCGDIFHLSRQLIGRVDAIYDRAALVALPENMRERYTDHLIQTTEKAPQLLITYEYDQSLIPGPPFSISEKEVMHHYASSYTLVQVASQEIPGGMKGKCPAQENVWLLR